MDAKRKTTAKNVVLIQTGSTTRSTTYHLIYKERTFSDINTSLNNEPITPTNAKRIINELINDIKQRELSGQMRSDNAKYWIDQYKSLKLIQKITTKTEISIR